MTDAIFNEVKELQKLMAWHQFYTETESVQKKLAGFVFDPRSKECQKQIELQKHRLKEMKDEEARKVSQGQSAHRG